ncbi:hypothetical protein [Hymenobacter sp. PAMC 26628]|uniref:hypothetical protein n=1 Tax=Hymenobacter sp. PAMC 26628 TaxID=1484118 RepID=UPI000AF07875|nr:hypothetical protein [Hymenobacter sp. PAMC 26628]
MPLINAFAGQHHFKLKFGEAYTIVNAKKMYQLNDKNIFRRLIVAVNRKNAFFTDFYRLVDNFCA